MPRLPRSAAALRRREAAILRGSAVGLSHLVIQPSELSNAFCLSQCSLCLNGNVIRLKVIAVPPHCGASLPPHFPALLPRCRGTSPHRRVTNTPIPLTAPTTMHESRIQNGPRKPRKLGPYQDIPGLKNPYHQPVKICVKMAKLWRHSNGHQCRPQIAVQSTWIIVTDLPLSNPKLRVRGFGLILDHWYSKMELGRHAATAGQTQKDAQES
ncbi:hypothetical protein FB451DRAFT_1177233 [Mycena latifolia]|nr:hypothetical protein FB451DRAFT_1177233 [Mycena latifolia]